MWVLNTFSVLKKERRLSWAPSLTCVNSLSKISEEEIERIMSGQEFEEEANHWSNHGDSDHSSPGNRASESNQPSPGSTLSSRWASRQTQHHLGITQRVHRPTRNLWAVSAIVLLFPQSLGQGRTRMTQNSISQPAFCWRPWKCQQSLCRLIKYYRCCLCPYVLHLTK